MASHLGKFGEMRASPELMGQLEGISVATVGRILRRIGQDTYRLPRQGPERANQVAREIPMGRIPWNEEQPGHFEMDLVHHCGAAAVGEYVHTLQMVDVARLWRERAGGSTWTQSKGNGNWLPAHTSSSTNAGRTPPYG